MERIKTYIKGFDELIESGFPKNSIIVISGNAGTGKTIFSTEFIYNGAKFANQMGVYFTFEQKKKTLFEQAKQFGWNLEEEEKKNKIKIISIGLEEINKGIVDELIEIVTKLKAKRVVIDSINTLSFLSPEESTGNCENKVKKFLYYFITKFKEIEDLTTLLISQKNQDNVDSLIKYLADGIINIEYDSLGGDFSRNLNIPKMRKTKNNEDTHSVEISNQGIIIHNLE